MIESVTVTNPLGESITLELMRPAKSGIAVAGIDGLGPVKAEINTSSSYGIDGARFNSARVGTRNIVLTLAFLDGYRRSIEEIREFTYKYFPIKENVRLDIVTSRKKLSIDGYVESNTPEIFSSQEATQISIICGRPYFRRTDNGESTRVQLYETVPMFSFPLRNDSTTTKEIMMGDSRYFYAKEISYFGDIATGFRIYAEFTGDVTGFSVSNLGNGKTMMIDSAKLITLTGSNFRSGDILVISTVVGEKSVLLYRGGTPINIINCMAKPWSWLTLQRGGNTIGYDAILGQDNVMFSLDHETLVEGV